MFFWKNYPKSSISKPVKVDLVEELQKITEEAIFKEEKENRNRSKRKLDHILGEIVKSAKAGYFKYCYIGWPFGYYAKMDDYRNYILNELTSKGLSVHVIKGDLFVDWEKK